MTVFWSALALEDIEQIVRYLEPLSESAGARLLRRVADRMDFVDMFPRMGRTVPELNEPTLREVLVDDYRVWYRLLGDDVEVVAILHGSRDTRG